MRSAASSGQILRFGLFEADVARNTLTRKGVRVKIQDQPFHVLILLLQQPGEIIPREELREKLWPEGTYVDFDGSLNVILKKLRAALDDDSDNPTFIETVPRRGYRFIAPVTLAIVAESPTSSDGAGRDVATELNSDKEKMVQAPNLHQAPPTRHLIYSASAIVLLVVAGFAWYLRSDFSRVRTDTMKPAAASVPIPRTSVAVLGFHNLSGKADDGWLATALSEMLSTELAAGEKLRLVSGEDVANLRLSSPWSSTDTLDKKSTARIGSALNSDLLVLGSYATVGRPDREQLRLDVRLQAAKTGEILSEIAEIGSRQDVLQLVSAIGEKLRSRLGVPQLDQPDQVSVAASLPSNREAARLYALGVVKLRDFDALAARDLLQQACNADSKFALGHAMLARAWNQLGYEQKRKEEAKKALDLSVNLPRAERMLVKGDYYESLADHEKAASTYRALFELFPDNVEYGLLLATAQNAAAHGSQALETIAHLRQLPAPASDDPRIDLAESSSTPNKRAALELVRSAVGKAKAQGKKLVYARARAEECSLQLGGDHPEQAFASCDDAYNIFLAAGDRLGAADTIRLKGGYEDNQGQHEQAIATFQRALNILQELGEHEKTGAVLNSMAIVFTNEGRLDRGEELYRRAKAHFELAGDKGRTAAVIADIADLSYLRGDLPAAARLYQQSLEIQTSLDHGDPGYALSRLSDVALLQGRVQDAQRFAQQAIDAIRPTQGGYEHLSGAMTNLGEALEAAGDLQGARQQFQAALDMQKQIGQLVMVEESYEELADVAMDEGHGEQAEPLLRAAIAEFEKDKGNPDQISAYALLSRTLLMQGKLEDADKAIRHAAELGRTVPDLALRFSIAIQSARVELAKADRGGGANLRPVTAIRELRSTIERTRKLGYYGIECDARLALGEWEMKRNELSGRPQLTALVSDARSHGLELLARQAEQAISTADSETARR
jgi:DNA-binding winged helix-turn-helix (wHTH) protein/tetratricopeptide (TPR) repeat protein